MSRAFWEDTWDLMVKRHGMADPGPEARETIVSYLSEAFPPPAEPGGWKNPFTGN